MTRRDFLKNIQDRIQQTWKDEHLHDSNLPEDPSKEKFFVTFPFPYMNGRLHVGHAFSLTKCEFMARYQKLKGKNVLWPFGFHLTGMPIAACADKLAIELHEKEFDSSASRQTDHDEPDVKTPGKFSGGRTKLVAKGGTSKSQKEILLSMNIPEEEIPEFIHTQKWVEYFTPLGMYDLQNMGVAVDWRRSFVTTDVNPYFDSFVQWQFLVLKERGYIKFGLRPAIFDISSKQACLDHDRASGEGVGPQDYTLIKMKALAPLQNHDLHGDIYLVCATFRPETMYGQTNCYVQPEGKYGIYCAFAAPKSMPDGINFNAHVMSTADAMKTQVFYLCSERAATNMGFQGIIPVDSNYQPICAGVIAGRDLIGLPVSAPLSAYDVVRVLPMLGVSMNKGSGVVTSVPSDSADDYAALKDLQNKPGLREKYGVKEEWVKLDLIEIIDMPGLGTRGAEVVYDRLKIQSQNDKQKLVEAKAELYKKGFYEGVMTVGKYKGQLVQEVKDLVKADLISSGDAVAYLEPEKEVIARTGAECVVALCDQWYLDYADPEWKSLVRKWVQNEEIYDETGHTSGFNCYSAASKNQFLTTIEWLKQWACSRNYGLGSRIPWEKSCLIESLSDSTLYFAYYTICHLLHSDVMGKEEGDLKIPANQIEPDFWTFVFGLSDVPPQRIPLDKAQRCREEFNYWYPMDLRSSGKELIMNHLTMALFNHAAIFKDNITNRMPRSYFCNGHVLVDSAKMSKSAGNFLTLEYCIQEYTADGLRIALADAGDTLEDANFQRENATNSLMRLYNVCQFSQQIVDGTIPTCDEHREVDLMLINEMSALINKAADHYDNMRFREGLKFSFFDMLNARDFYKTMCDNMKIRMNKQVIMQWIKYFAIIMSVIAPHTCEYIWRDVLKQDGSVCNQLWPEVGSVDPVIQSKRDYLHHVLDNIHKSLEKGGKKSKTTKVSGPMNAVIYVQAEYFPWQVKILEFVHENVKFDKNHQAVDNSYPGMLKEFVKDWPKSESGTAIAFGVHFIKEEVPTRGQTALNLTPPFDEVSVLNDYRQLLQVNKLRSVIVMPANECYPRDKTKTRMGAKPLKPAIFFESAE